MADPIIVIKEGGGGQARGGGKGREESAEKSGEEGSAVGKFIEVEITDSNGGKPKVPPIPVPGQPGGSGRIVMHFEGNDYELPVRLKFRIKG